MPIKNALTVTELQHLEDLFDQNKLSLEAWQNWPELGGLFRCIFTNDFEQMHEVATELFAQCQTVDEQAFILQWAVASSEVEFNLERRAEYLTWWAKIDGWAQSDYANYLRVFHEGLSAFFAGHLRDAERFFTRARRIALSANYHRGIQRSIYHLGLVARDLRRYEHAIKFYQQALAHAKSRQDLKAERKMMAEIAKLERPEVVRSQLVTGPVSGQPDLIAGPISTGLTHAISAEHLYDYDALIYRELQARNFIAARRLLAAAERLRRRLRYGRRHVSWYVYSALLNIYFNRPTISQKLAAKITDPVLKSQYLELKRQLFGMSKQETVEYNQLREFLGLGNLIVVHGSSPEQIEIAGQPLAEVSDQTVRRLMGLLIEQPGELSKDRICKELWNLDYDPILHDNKIHKVIHRARSQFGVRDLIVNTYGGYRINSKI